MSDLSLEWDNAYLCESSKHKNKYPSEHVITWVLNNYSPGESSIRAIDIGCGWGNNLRFLLDQGFDATGIDQSLVAIKRLKKEFNNRVLLGSVKMLPFKDKSQDFIIDRNSIQHNIKTDIEIILKECKRVLKKGGKIFSCMTIVLHAIQRHRMKSKVCFQGIQT
jgi:ubiquinone/menaquinone biosynthesis C-methylase UbiE